MLEESTVVQSAISSFNNMALFGPDFFWSAVLALPIFAIFWIMGNEIVARFMPNESKRRENISIVIISAITIWILSHGAFGVLRDQSWVPVLSALVIFVCTTFITRRVAKLELKSFVKNEKWQKRNRWILPLSVIILTGLTGEPTWMGFALNAVASGIGILSGLAMNKMKKQEYDSIFVIASLVTVITFAVAMQPEFFRFGQMGQLTITHIFALALFFKIASLYFITHWFKPRGKLSVGYYKKIMLISRLFQIITILLFVFTESALALGLFFATSLFSAFISVRHLPENSNLKNTETGLWNLIIGIFGIIINVPLFVCIAIVLWKINTPQKFITTIKSLL